MKEVFLSLRIISLPKNWIIITSLSLLSFWSDFGLSLVWMFKNYKISLFSQIKMIITSLRLLSFWSEFGINVQKQYNFTIFTLMIYQWGSDNRSVTHFASIVGFYFDCWVLLWLLGFTSIVGFYFNCWVLCGLLGFV